MELSEQWFRRGWRYFQEFFALFSLVYMFASLFPSSEARKPRRLTTSVDCLASSYDTPPPLPGKKGACFTLREEGKPGSWVENMPKVKALKPYWNYSWNRKRVEAQPDDIEFIPMIWGLGKGKEEKLLRMIEEDIMSQIEAGTAKRILGFNEPDHLQQANMQVETALSYWPILQELPLAVVSPSVAQMDGDWLYDFVDGAKQDCYRLDYVGVHWYSGPRPDKFKRKMVRTYLNSGMRPLMLTEFAVADWDATTVEENRFSQEQVLNFMKDVIPWLEAQPWVAGYSWFSFKETRPQGASSALFREDGSITALGEFYASVTTENPRGNRSISAL